MIPSTATSCVLHWPELGYTPIPKPGLYLDWDYHEEQNTQLEKQLNVSILLYVVCELNLNKFQELG
jgi:hypothetical protein